MTRFFLLAMRRSTWIAALGAAMLAGCGGGSSGPEVAAAPQVKLAFSAPQVSAGESATLTWSSTNASSCAASGNWTGSQPASGSATFVLPAAGSFTYHLDCTGTGGSAGGEAVVAVVSPAVPVAPPAPVAAAPPAGAPVLTNVLSVAVDRGPSGTSFNMPFVSVTVCSPGTTTCRTVDHILVDTGSTGLRLMASALGSGMDLPVIATSAGLPVAECAQFASGFSWGSVRRADIRLAGETAARMPVQLISDPSAAFSVIPAACSNTGANLGSVAALGANGILGVDMSVQDCGAIFVTSTAPRLYYGCTSTTCLTSVLPLDSQVTNPVAAFALNNNGLALTLPPVQVGGAAAVLGTLTFGIGTQPNNQLDRATVFTTNSRGQFTTVYKGTTYPSSFVDSGSNGLFFDDASIPTCSSFFCPTAPLTLTAVNVSPSGATVSVSFTIDNARSLTAGISAFNLGGTLGLTRTFDFGLPFFFGRTVFVALQGAQTPKGVGPYLAY